MKKIFYLLILLLVISSCECMCGAGKDKQITKPTYRYTTEQTVRYDDGKGLFFIETRIYEFKSSLIGHEKATIKDSTSSESTAKLFKSEHVTKAETIIEKFKFINEVPTDD